MAVQLCPNHRRALADAFLDRGLGGFLPPPRGEVPPDVEFDVLAMADQTIIHGAMRVGRSDAVKGVECAVCILNAHAWIPVVANLIELEVRGRCS
jgi:hypothetical protein